MIVRGIFCLILVISLLACSEQGEGILVESPPSLFRVGTNVWPGYEPLYLAKELGAWTEKEVRLVEYPSASDVLRAFRNQSLEAASLTLDEVLLLKQLNVPVAIVLVHDISVGADVIMGRPDIKAVADMKGKRIGVEAGALGALVLTRALEMNHLGLDDVTIVDITVNTHEVAYDNNEVDAVVTFEPVKTRLANKGAGVIFSSADMPGEIVDVLVVRKDILDDRAEVIQKLIDGWFSALEYKQENERAAASIMASRLKVSESEVLASFDGISLPTRQENHGLLNPSGGGLKQAFTSLKKVMLMHGLLASDVEVDGLFTDRFVKD